MATTLYDIAAQVVRDVSAWIEADPSLGDRPAVADMPEVTVRVLAAEATGLMAAIQTVVAAPVPLERHPRVGPMTEGVAEKLQLILQATREDGRVHPRMAAILGQTVGEGGKPHPWMPSA